MLYSICYFKLLNIKQGWANYGLWSANYDLMFLNIHLVLHTDR